MDPRHSLRALEEAHADVRRLVSWLEDATAALEGSDKRARERVCGDDLERLRRRIGELAQSWQPTRGREPRRRTRQPSPRGGREWQRVIR